jgi:hypothetical protein
MAREELQDWRRVARGWARKSSLVRFLYLSKALLRISWKLEDEEDEEAVGRV